MNIQDFQAKWRGSQLKERSASQEHFIDLCRTLGFPTPADVDKTGDFYTFEKGAAKSAGGQGFADVWWKGKFAWEYKGLKADMRAAYQQLLQYREDLENPPLLVVCDLHRFEVHTNFTGTAKQVHAFSVDELDLPDTLRILRAVFEDSDRLRPTRTVESVTEEAARRFGALAQQLHTRGVEPERAAHFLVQLLFCLFAEDVGLLPRGLFGRLLAYSATRPERFTEQITELFEAMRDGGDFSLNDILRFNGGLFAKIDVVPLEASELTELSHASTLDWSSVEPAIFGTLFERSLDPDKRSQLGAHYTGRRDIERVVEPVVMAPLRRRWDAVKAQAATIIAAREAANTAQVRRNRESDLAALLFGFQEELVALRVLDPACGSGNFLYVALAALKDLEKEVGAFGAANGLPMMLPRVSPSQTLGLEINEVAHELAQVVIWIGYLQWMATNGFQVQRDPVLDSLDSIKLQDALLDRSDPANPKEAEWPAADFIIGNPPFLGGKRLRAELSDAYVDDLFAVYTERVPREADLVVYFFEKARSQIAVRATQRVGLLSTNSIRGGANRQVLKRIKETGDIFAAWSDEPWILNGAAVRISIVGFDDGSDPNRFLNEDSVETINADLTSMADLAAATRLRENRSVAYQGFGKAGPFDLPPEVGVRLLAMPSNPNGRSNADVVKPWMNSLDVTRRPRGMYIIDFAKMTLDDAALYEAPFEYVRREVKPLRDANRDTQRRTYWWRLGRTGDELRRALAGLTRYIASPTVSKHRIFVWLDESIVPDHQLNFFARDDDYFFGVVHSRAHEVWSLRMGTWLGKGNDPRYTPTTCFETFAFPRPTDEQRDAIAAAAKWMDELRRNWLNPPDASEAELKKRTLTNLYNERPTWLRNAHAALDRAVWAAYGWPEPPEETDDETILTRLLALNLERAAEERSN